MPVLKLCMAQIKRAFRTSVRKRQNAVDQFGDLFSCQIQCYRKFVYWKVAISSGLSIILTVSSGLYIFHVEENAVPYYNSGVFEVTGDFNISGKKRMKKKSLDTN